MKKLPPSLYNELISGLQLMLALRLSGSPAADTVAATATAWEIALTTGKEWDEQADAGRFDAAFSVLAGTQRYWPAPCDLLNALPPRSEPLKIEYQYWRTPEEKAAGQRNLKAIQTAIKQVLTKQH